MLALYIYIVGTDGTNQDLCRLLRTILWIFHRKGTRYWEDADNWTRGYDRIRNAIRDFEPLQKYNIPKEISNEIFPVILMKEKMIR